MLDVVELGPQPTFGNTKYARKLFSHVAHSRRIRKAILCMSQHTQPRRCIQNLFVQVCGRIARDSDVVHVFESNACGFETVTDRVFRETGAMLKAIEAFFFDRGDQSAVFDDCR